jgi:Na+/H+-dicarboxylate symporter
LLVADAYDQLLRVSLLPYVTVSLISGIGALSRAQAVLIGTRVGTVVLTK